MSIIQQTTDNEGSINVNLKNAQRSTQPALWIGWVMLALVLGTVTFTIALLLLPTSLRHLSTQTVLESSDVQSDEGAGLDGVGDGFSFHNESLADSVALIQDAVPGITNETTGLPTFDNRVATAGGQFGLEGQGRNDVASFRSTAAEKKWSIIDGSSDGFSQSSLNGETGSGSIVLARAISDNPEAPVSQGGAAVASSGTGTSTQGSDSKQQAPTPASTGNSTEAARQNDKPTLQSLGEVRNKTTIMLSRMLDSGFYGGYESDYLWLLDKSSLGLRIIQPGQQAISVSPADSYGPGGRVWIGMRAAERGVRATYSFYNGQNQNDADSDGIAPVLSRAIAVRELQTFDIEVTQPFQLAGVDLEVTAGARHLQYESIDSLYSLVEPNSFLHTVGASSATNHLAALGFTGSIHGRHVLPSAVFGDLLPFLRDDCDVSGCFTRRSYWYWDARASALWGESKAAALTSAAVSVNDPSGTVGYAASRDYAMATNASESMLGTLELQLGIEHRRRIFVFPNADLVFRTGIDFRRFSLGRSHAAASSFAFLEDEDDTFGLRMDAHAASHDQVLRMFGLVFAFGANY